MSPFTSTAPADHVAPPPALKALLHPFALFTTEWKRVGMPGEPRWVPDDGTVSVAVTSWGVRVFYLPLSAFALLSGRMAGEGATPEGEARIARALDAGIEGALDRAEPIEGAAYWEAIDRALHVAAHVQRARRARRHA